MAFDLWLIGIGTGSESHLTREGVTAIQEAAHILVPKKGTNKDDLAALRLALIAACDSTAEIHFFDYPLRDDALPYQTRVALWHDEIAQRWRRALPTHPRGPVALLVWGDPSLYDSTLRIAARLAPQPKVRVVPGITALQALTAAHAIPLNTVNGAVTITTGRQLARRGWPKDAESVVVMLDGEMRFLSLLPEGLTIWWGAYLGMREQILCHGPLAEVAQEIAQMRHQARAKHGWIMDTYLLRKEGNRVLP